MPHRWAEIAFTPGVQDIQTAYATRVHNQRLQDSPIQSDVLGERERAFIEQCDGFYLATVSETGWPYVQYRGGPAGFLKVLDEKTLAYADFRGNLQYVSMGNLRGQGKAALILMDYARRRRLKLFARVRFQNCQEAPEFAEQVRMPDYPARVERVVVLELEAFDWNCPQHITPRYRESEILALVEPLQQRLAELEQENARLRAQTDRSSMGPG